MQAASSGDVPDGADPWASFRDPDGAVVIAGGRVFRVAKARAADELLDFLTSSLAQRLIAEGRLAATTIVRLPEGPTATEPSVGSRIEEGGVVLEHERIPFPSYPCEWCPGMLHDAANLTLLLAEQALPAGFGLKDATPYNVLFRGPEPVFVDLLSFERREKGDPTWRPYAQFIRTFLLPLLANKHYGLRLDQMLTSRRDGLEPEEVYRLLRARHKFAPPFLSLVTIPKWLGSRMDQDDTGIYRKKLLPDDEKARFILSSLLGGLRRALRRAEPRIAAKSNWSEYMQAGSSYSQEELAAKQTFVREAFEELAPKRVLDVGCNTGHFSRLAAGSGAAVVAIDQDPIVIEHVWRAARAQRENILPLVIDLCRPTPALGWRNRESPSFLERAQGSFDMMLMLAVIHHMLVTERIPLEQILDMAADLTREHAIVEFVGPEDPMFRRLLRGREELHRDLTAAAFEAACRRRFQVIRCQRLRESSRWLFLLRKAADYAPEAGR